MINFIPKRRLQPNYTVNGEKMVRQPNPHDPPQVRSLWHPTYKLTKDYYAASNAPDPEMEGRNAAWRAVDIFIAHRGRVGWIERGPVTWKDSEVVEDPGSVSVIGKLMEVTYFASEYRFDVIKFQEPGLPDLLWDDRRKRLLCYTELHAVNLRTDVDHEKVQEENKMYRRWHQRDAGAYQIAKARPTEVNVMGAADSIIYRSDKWDAPNTQPDLQGSPEYLHQHDLGVFTSTNPGSDTRLIVVQGGKLDALTAGIIH